MLAVHTIALLQGGPDQVESQASRASRCRPMLSGNESKGPFKNGRFLMFSEARVRL